MGLYFFVFCQIISYAASDNPPPLLLKSNVSLPPKLPVEKFYLLTRHQLKALNSDVTNDQCQHFEAAARHAVVNKELEWMRYLFNLLPERDKKDCSTFITVLCGNDNSHRSIHDLQAQGYTLKVFEETKNELMDKIKQLFLNQKKELQETAVIIELQKARIQELNIELNALTVPNNSTDQSNNNEEEAVPVAADRKNSCDKVIRVIQFITVVAFCYLFHHYITCS